MAWGGRTDLDSWLEDVVGHWEGMAENGFVSVQWLILISGDQETHRHTEVWVLTCGGHGGRERANTVASKAAPLRLTS